MDLPARPSFCTKTVEGFAQLQVDLLAFQKRDRLADEVVAFYSYETYPRGRWR